MLLDKKGGVSICPGRSSDVFIFFIDKNWIWTMTRDHSNNILLTRNLPFDSDVGEAILYLYHCIVCGLNRTIERVVNLNVTWLCFCFVFALISFIHMNSAVAVA